MASLQLFQGGLYAARAPACEVVELLSRIHP